MDNRFDIQNSVLVKFEGGGAVTVPEGVCEIGEFAFIGNTDITEVVLCKGVTRIGQQAFRGCDNLERVTLPEGLIEISRFAFWDCGSLKEINIPQSVDVIGNSAFRGCDILSKITLPDEMTRIGESAFSDCGSIESITVPKGIEIIRKRTFSDCRSLASLTIPEGIKEIDDFAFEYCSSLCELSLPSGVEYIGKMAFSNCTALEKASVPESVSMIGSCAFYKTPAAENCEGGFAVMGGGVLTACTLDDEQITIPTGVRVIGESAFSCKGNLKSVVIPEGVETIASLAFEHCASLESAALPSTLKAIDGGAFVECSSLGSLTLPDSLVRIGANAFYDTAMLTRDSSDVIIYNGKYLYRCSVEALCYDVPQGITLIADGAFAGASGITELTLPESLEYIGSAAFKWLSALKSIAIPDSVKFIGSEAFMNSYELHAKMSFAGKQIGEGAFPHGSRLTLTDNGRPFTAVLVDDTSGSSPLFGFVSKPCGGSFSALEYDEYMIPAAAAYIDEIKECREYLEENITVAICYAVNLMDEELIERLLSLDIASADELDNCISYAISHDRLEQQMTLMRKKNELVGGSSASDIVDSRLGL